MEQSEAKKDEESETPQGIFKEIFRRVLLGVAAVGRGVRSSVVQSSTCIQRTVYPFKEFCINRYDEVARYVKSGDQIDIQPEEVEYIPRFEQQESIESEDSLDDLT